MKTEKTCPQCNVQFQVKKSHLQKRIYCSIACRCAAKPKAIFTCGCGEQITRRAKKCKGCAGKERGQYLISIGYNPRMFSSKDSEEKRLAYIKSDENRRRISSLTKGKSIQRENGRRFSPRHCSAVECLLRDAKGIVHYCANISAFVFNNKDLFLAEDTIQKEYRGHARKSYQCNATLGLSRIYRGYRGSWKGWTLVSDVEIAEGQWDLLRRKYDENPKILIS